VHLPSPFSSFTPFFIEEGESAPLFSFPHVDCGIQRGAIIVDGSCVPPPFFPKMFFSPLFFLPLVSSEDERDFPFFSSRGGAHYAKLPGFFFFFFFFLGVCGSREEAQETPRFFFFLPDQKDFSFLSFSLGARDEPTPTFPPFFLENERGGWSLFPSKPTQ